MSNEIPEEKWKAEHAIFREQIPGYSRSGFSFFQGEMFYLAGRNAGQAEIDLYSNAFKTADELRISSAERYDKEIEKRDVEIERLKARVKSLGFNNDYVEEVEDKNWNMGQEIQKRDELLNTALKHLDIVCSFLNTNKGSER